MALDEDFCGNQVRRSEKVTSVLVGGRFVKIRSLSGGVGTDSCGAVNSPLGKGFLEGIPLCGILHIRPGGAIWPYSAMAADKCTQQPRFCSELL